MKQCIPFLIYDREQKQLTLVDDKFAEMFERPKLDNLELLGEINKFMAEHPEKLKRYRLNQYPGYIDIIELLSTSNVSSRYTILNLVTEEDFKSLLNQKNHYEKIIEECPISVVLTDQAGTIEYVNKKFCEVSGYSKDEAIGQNPRILKSGELPDETYKELWETLISGHIWTGLFHNKRKDSTLYWENVAISPLMDGDGRITHFMAVKEDITEKRELEAQLLQSQKLESVGQLAAGIAHEINTPIQFIGDNLQFIGSSLKEIFGALQELMKSETVDVETLGKVLEEVDFDFVNEEIPKAVAESLDGVKRVAKIVNAMKDFSHISSDEFVKFDLNRAIEDTITISRNQWKNYARVETDLQKDLPLITCIGGGINQVLLNLLINAGHAIEDQVKEKKYEMGEISIKTFEDTKNVKVTITDNGCGIPEELKHRVFEPFFTTKAVGKGTGQGLSIVYNEIVNKHHGEIDISSSPGEGTTFEITLPIEQPAS